MRGKRGLQLLLIGILAAVLSSSAVASQTYTVRQGDSLWTIAKRFGVSIDALKSTNQVSANKPLPIGKKLVIPSGSPAKEATPNSTVGHANKSGVILRSGPNTSSRKLGVLAQGTTLKMLAKSGKWNRVETGDGRSGWVYSPLISSGPGSINLTSATVQGQQAEPEATAATEPEQVDEAGRQKLIRAALANRGARYRYGGTSRSGFDCSGFTRYVYAQQGIALPHSSRAQYSHGKPVSRQDLQEGDLVFFRTTRSGISHVGIYIGNGNFVHASNTRRGVVVDSLGSAYYKPRYVGARRVK